MRRELQQSARIRKRFLTVAVPPITLYPSPGFRCLATLAPPSGPASRSRLIAAAKMPDNPGGQPPMPRPRFTLLLRCAALAASFVVCAGKVHAQPQLGNQLPQPRLNTVAPAGGKVGTTFELVFTGTDLEGPESLLFNHPGIKATLFPPDP